MPRPAPARSSGGSTASSSSCADTRTASRACRRKCWPSSKDCLERGVQRRCRKSSSLLHGQDHATYRFSLGQPLQRLACPAHRKSLGDDGLQLTLAKPVEEAREQRLILSGQPLVGDGLDAERCGIFIEDDVHRNRRNSGRKANGEKTRLEAHGPHRRLCIAPTHEIGDDVNAARSGGALEGGGKLPLRRQVQGPGTVIDQNVGTPGARCSEFLVRRGGRNDERTLR